MGMVTHLLFRLSHDHNSSVARPQDLDRRGIEAREGLSRDHLFRCPDRDLSMRHIDHAIDGGEDGVNIMGYQQYRCPRLPADLPDHARYPLLVPQIQTL